VAGAEFPRGPGVFLQQRGRSQRGRHQAGPEARQSEAGPGRTRNNYGAGQLPRPHHGDHHGDGPTQVPEGLRPSFAVL